MIRGLLKICSLSVGCFFWETVGSGTCDSGHDDASCYSSLLESSIEFQEERESAIASFELLQATKHKKANVAVKRKRVPKQTETDHDGKQEDVATKSADHDVKQDNVANKSGSIQKESLSAFVSKDHNDKMCMLCGKPLAERVDRAYTEFRTDCGALSSATGPDASTLSTPISTFTTISETGVVSNGFCQLNFAKSCVDAVANKDYLYWAKSINLLAPGSIENAAWDGRYCRLNGFLKPNLVALQHNFTATQAIAAELCKTKYAKYSIDKITFTDMMASARYDDKTAPTLAEAELLAAWNCAMGDLGCDMALCAYSFCEKGSETGLYDECKGWHAVHGMPPTFLEHPEVRGSSFSA